MPTASEAPTPNTAAALRAALDQHGPGLIDDAARLHGLLLRQCPQQIEEIVLLMSALSHQVPQALRRASGSAQAAATTAVLVQHLQGAARLSPDDARWAVDAWAYALSGSSTALVPQAQPLQPLQQPAQAAAPAHTVELLAEGTAPATRLAARAASVPTSARRRGPWVLGTAAAVAVAAVAVAAYAFLAIRMEVTDVVTAGPVAGNGKPHELTLRYSAQRADIASIDVRVLHGSATFPSPQWSVAVPLPTQSKGALSAGTLSTRTQVPQQATLAFTLVDRKGQRSEPFEKTFDIVPPATITQALTPPRITVGQAYAVTLNYRRGGSDIVKVVRRVVESDTAWPEPEHSMAVQLTQGEGQHEVRFDPPARPMRSTLEFTLVDAAGISSEPVRVQLAAGQPMAVGVNGTVINVTRLGGASGLGAVGGAVAGAALGNRLGGGSGRAALTALGAVGGAVVGHQVEANVRGATLWETTVQLDGGGLSRVRHANPPRWQPGSRVRVVGGAIHL